MTPRRRGIDGEGVPRYAPPTAGELDEMFAEPTPGQVMEECTHMPMCVRAADLGYDGPGWRDRTAERLRCDECEYWERPRVRRSNASSDMD